MLYCISTVQFCIGICQVAVSVSSVGRFEAVCRNSYAETVVMKESLSRFLLKPEYNSIL